MELKHTPGPWRFYTEPQPNGCQIVGAGGLMVAMLAHTVNQADQKETAIANAAAISATPDALALAQDFQIKGPDDDGLLWLVVKGKAMFNLGSADGIAGKAAIELESDRQAVLQKASGK